jgi:hypothetical protein
MIISGVVNSIDELNQKIAGLNLDKGDNFIFKLTYEYTESIQSFAYQDYNTILLSKIAQIKDDMSERLRQYNASVNVTGRILSQNIDPNTNTAKTTIEITVDGEVDIAPAVVIVAIIIAVVGAYLITANLKQIYYYVTYKSYIEAKEKGINVNPPSSLSDLATLIPIAILGLLIFGGREK